MEGGAAQLGVQADRRNPLICFLSLLARRRLNTALERINGVTVSWPEDGDGDVFRRLEAHGFDFSRPHSVDFNVDFETWPPPHAAIEKLRSMFGDVQLYAPEDDDEEEEEENEGYALFQVHDRISYELITSVQRKVSAAMKPFGGVCESWGVMQDAI